MTDWREMAHADLLSLGMAADDVRRRERPGNLVTYLRVHVLTAERLGNGEEVPAAAAEVRLYETPATIDEAVAALSLMKRASGGRRIAAFSMAALLERGWGSPDLLRRLVDAGLDDVAELPVDQVPDLAASVRMLSAAGAPPQRLTVAEPLGEGRLEAIARVKAVVEEFPQVRRFAPLPRRAPADRPTTGYEDVRMVALSRLALPDRSIEVDWRQYGPKLAQVALTFGADHLDAVPAVDDLSHGPRRATIAEVHRNVRAAGFEPEEVRAR